MLDFLFFLVVLAPAPMLAIVVLAVRLRDAVRRGGVGTFAARTRATWQDGTGHPVWPGLIAVAGGAAVLTVGLERSYLATVTNGSRWGLDMALLTMMLGLLAAILCAALASLAAAAVARARGFGAGTVAGLLALAAVAAGTASAHRRRCAADMAVGGRRRVASGVPRRHDRLLDYGCSQRRCPWRGPRTPTQGRPWRPRHGSSSVGSTYRALHS